MTTRALATHRPAALALALLALTACSRPEPATAPAPAGAKPLPAVVLPPRPTDAAYIAPGSNTLVSGLGGEAGYGEINLVGNSATTALTAGSFDDGYWTVNLSAVFPNGIDFFGTKYSASTQVFVGTNGYFTFGTGSSSYTPQGIQYSAIPIIAIFYGDAEMRTSIAPTTRAYLDVDTSAADPVVTLTYLNVPAYNTSSPTNSY